jgi:hypothetical protein
MSPAAKEFEDFARDCVRLAGQAENPELRDRLLEIARDWRQAAKDELANEHRRLRRPIAH